MLIPRNVEGLKLEGFQELRSCFPYSGLQTPKGSTAALQWCFMSPELVTFSATVITRMRFGICYFAFPQTNISYFRCQKAQMNRGLESYSKNTFRNRNTFLNQECQKKLS